MKWGLPFEDLEQERMFEACSARGARLTGSSLIS